MCWCAIIHVLVLCNICSYVVWCVLLLLCVLNCYGCLFVFLWLLMLLIMLVGVCVVGFSVSIGVCCFSEL